MIWPSGQQTYKYVRLDGWMVVFLSQRTSLKYRKQTIYQNQL